MRFHKGRDVFECVSRVVGRAVLTCGNRRSENDARRATLNSKLSTLNSSGFTLIELLIVTVVIVTLMGIVFRLAGVGGDQRAKSKTQARLQRLENAVSGYYAAYGSYPPVPLEGRSRDINVRVDENGVQGGQKNNVNLSNPQKEDKRQIEAACRAQPVAVLFPFFMNSSVNGELKSKNETLVNGLAMDKKMDFSPLNNVGGLNIGKEEEATLFQFGLLSFLLPRYRFMLGGAPEMYDTPHSRWSKNNQLPCRIDTGKTYENWESMQEYLYGSRGDGDKEKFLIDSLSSQAVCSRWMPNLEGIVSGGLEFYGIDTQDGDWPFLASSKYDALPRDDNSTDDKKRWFRTFSPRGYDSKGSMYLLNGMTVADGWGREFYYYSDPPYQSYRLWSAGKNGYTFPPWLMEHLDSYSTKEQSTITGWTSDDISHLAN